MPKFDEKETEDLKNVLYGLTMIDTGHKLLASGSEKIRNVIARMASLEKLATLLGSIQNTDANLLSVAKSQSKIPVTSGRCLPMYLRPEGLGGTKFRCRVCTRIFGSWTGCDSHIRSTHSHVKYGPCRKCTIFVSCNYDSFKRHEATCDDVSFKTENPMKSE